MISGETIHQNNLNESEKNEYSLGFGNENGSDFFLTDGDVNDFSSSSNFEVHEKIEVSHGMLVSTRQTANTFYHQLMPSKTVKVHLHPMIMQRCPIVKSDPRTIPKSGYLSDKFMTFSRGIIQSLKPWRNTAVRTLISMIAILNAYWIFYGEHLEDKEALDEVVVSYKDSKVIEGNYSCKTMKKMKLKIMN